MSHLTPNDSHNYDYDTPLTPDDFDHERPESLETTEDHQQALRYCAERLARLRLRASLRQAGSFAADYDEFPCNATPVLDLHHWLTEHYHDFRSSTLVDALDVLVQLTDASEQRRTDDVERLMDELADVAPTRNEPPFEFPFKTAADYITGRHMDLTPPEDVHDTGRPAHRGWFKCLRGFLRSWKVTIDDPASLDERPSKWLQGLKLVRTFHRVLVGEPKGDRLTSDGSSTNSDPEEIENPSSR